VTASRLPAGDVAMTVHRGPYAGLVGAGEALDAWLAGSGWRPDGQRIVRYLQFGADAVLRVPAAWLVERSADLVTELQQPVA
jgi:hypothetical protein